MNTIDIGSKIKKLRSKKSIEIGKKYTGAMLANELGISRVVGLFPTKSY